MGPDDVNRDEVVSELLGDSVDVSLKLDSVFVADIWEDVLLDTEYDIELNVDSGVLVLREVAPWDVCRVLTIDV